MAWKRTVLTIAKANGTYAFPLSANQEQNGLADGRFHVVTVAAGDSTAGTVTFSALPYGGDVIEPVYAADGTTQRVITLTSGTSRSFNIDNYTMESFSVTNASVNGTGTITVTISSWCE